jgi:hypothetical protein
MTEQTSPAQLDLDSAAQPPEFISGGLGVGALLRFGAARCAIAR